MASDSAVTEYVVVADGVTLRVAGLAATPVCVVPSDQVTLQGAVPVRSAWIVAAVPLHTVVLSALLTTDVGLGFTVTTALPVRFPAWAVHLESVSAVTVYVVVDDGLTLRVAGLEATPVCVTPSDHVTFHGPRPVSAAWMVLELPLQIVPLPLATAVGLALTVMTALPVRSPATAVQLASERDVTV